MTRKSRRRSSLTSTRCYAFIENLNIQKLFQCSDDIFAALNLRLCIIDTDVTSENHIRTLRKKLLKAITENDSTVWPKSSSFNRIPEDLANDTIANEIELRDQVVRTHARYDKIREFDLQNDLLSSSTASSPSLSLQEIEKEVHDEIESSVIFDEKCHFFLCILMPEHGLPQYGHPLMGAAIALTGADGELEIRWAFSKLPQFLNELGPGKYQRISNELEGIFALRVIVEAMFLEDLRVQRRRANSLYRSERTQRFVSIVTVDFTHFPLGMANTLLRLPNMTRHYNTHEEKAALHKVPCRCRARLENMYNQSVSTQLELNIELNSASVNLTEEEVPTKDSDSNDTPTVTYISDSDEGETSTESGCLEMENEEHFSVNANSSHLNSEDVGAWSFYGISFNGFERALNQIFNMNAFAANAGDMDPGLLQILNQGRPSDDLLSFNDILVSRIQT